MNTEDRAEIERFFREQVESDPTQAAVEYNVVVETHPDGDGNYLWFDAVGDGEFSEALFNTISDVVYSYTKLPLVDGVTTATDSRDEGRIIGIGFSYDPEED